MAQVRHTIYSLSIHTWTLRRSRGFLFPRNMLVLVRERLPRFFLVLSYQREQQPAVRASVIADMA